jgi:Family of unknown function (DUF6496)
MAKKKTKSAKKVARAMHEVFTKKPSTATRKGGRKQLIAIALAKARKRGARVPKKPGK